MTDIALTKRQYYYRSDECKARKAADADCICWHDQGTGPYPDADDSFVWRASPSQVAPANPAPRVSEAKLPATKTYVDRLIRIFRDHPTDDTSAVVLIDYARAALIATIGAGEESYAQIVEPYAAAQRMIRDAIQELFGPIASLESEDATLLRGPEPHHEAEAQIDALLRVRDKVGAGGQEVAENAETLKARAAAVLCEAGTLCGWPAPNCNAREGAEALFNAGLLAHSSPSLPLKEEVERVLETLLNKIEIGIDPLDSRSDRRAYDAARDLLSRLRAGEQKGWRSMDSAPKDKTPVIIAVPNKDKNDYTIGEAYFDPDNYDGGDWWWAGTDYGDYHAGPISDINHNPPEYWQPLPASPSVSEGGSR